jgi:hypothetical protein
MTYIASFFHAFSSMDQAETVSRRVEKFAELMQSVWVSRNDYERRIRLVCISALTLHMTMNVLTVSPASFSTFRHPAAVVCRCLLWIIY